MYIYLIIFVFCTCASASRMKLIAGHVVSVSIFVHKSFSHTFFPDIQTWWSHTSCILSIKSNQRKKLAQWVHCRHRSIIAFNFLLFFRYGQLTSIGIEQQYRLGQYLRIRYGSILSTTFDPREIFVRSTDFDRTLMSAESNLHGLYHQRNISNNRTSVQPISMHTERVADDFVCHKRKTRHDLLVLFI